MSSALLTAVRALGAWERGEESGDYACFRAMLSPNFHLFCHPAPPSGRHGVHAGPTARTELDELIGARGLRPHAHAFANVVMMENGDTVVALFDVSGRTPPGESYAGQGAIAFLVDRNGIAGFREYAGGRTHLGQPVALARFQRRGA